MNTHQSGDASRDLTAAEVDTALHAALRDEGILLPKTIQDVAELEATLDMNGVPTPDPKAFSARLKAAKAGANLLPMPDSTSTTASEEDFAMAARNGGTLSPETRRKMHKLRAEYEARNRRTDDGQK